MPTHVIVESERALKSARKAFGEDVVWGTTSPWLLRKGGSALGLHIVSLESDETRETAQRMFRASVQFGKEFGTDLNSLCGWHGYADLKQIFTKSLVRSFGGIFYKAILLQGFLDRAHVEGDGRVVCVGNPDRIELDGINLNYGRFDTLYALLAAQGVSPELSVFHHDLPQDELIKKEQYSRSRKAGWWERALSLLTNTPSSFLFKIWRNLGTSGIYPFKTIRLTPRAEKNLLILRTCELIDEAFLSLLLQGAALGYLGRIPRVGTDGTPQPAEASLPDEEVVREKLQQAVKAALQAEDVPFSSACQAALMVCEGRIMTVLARFRQQLAPLSDHFQKMLAPFPKNPTVLTNALASTEELTFYTWARKNGVKVVSFEHGVTTGLSEWSRWNAMISTMPAADVGVYHTEEAAACYHAHFAEQQKIVVGLPRITEHVPFAAIQRWIGRRILGVKPGERVVIYVADLAQNNFIQGPGLGDDRHFMQKTEDIIRFLSGRFPDCRIVVKLYPSIRYMDDEEFCDLAALGNVAFIKDFEFRFLRASADELFVTSFQSTLGWVIGAGKPFTFIELDGAPILFGDSENREFESKSGIRGFKSFIRHVPMRTRKNPLFQEL